MALTPIAVLAVIHIPYPFGTDQAFFAYSARALSEGARLYVDFWDMKQPGIYWFYQGAGSLFGFDEVGIHSFEAVWMLACAAALVPLARCLLVSKELAYLAPLFCLGPYFATASYVRITMLEGVINLPIALFLLTLLQDPDAKPSAWRPFVLGALVTSIAFFKMILLIVPGAIYIGYWLLRLASPTREHPHVAAFVAHVARVALGAIIALGVLCIPLVRDDALGASLWTNFIYPMRALETFPHAPPERLARAYAWLSAEVWYLLPVVCFAGVGIFLRRYRQPALLLVVWLFGIYFAIDVQVLSHWIYHMNLYFVPLGLATLVGLDILRTSTAALKLPMRLASVRGAVPIAAGAVLVVLIARHIYWGVGWALLEHKVWRLDGVEAFQDLIAPEVRELRRSVTFLADPSSTPGAIAVLGDPRVVTLSGRDPLLAINAWGYALPEQLEEEALILRRDAPPYVYVSNYLMHLLTAKTPVLMDTVHELYVEHSRDAVDGIWYERRSSDLQQDVGVTTPAGFSDSSPAIQP